MVARTRVATAIKTDFPEAPAKLRITVFHCFNALDSATCLENEQAEIHSIKMPCSSMTREVFLLRAFEAGADAVVVLTCPEGQCKYLEGNIRAAMRVARVKKILDEIGIDGRRLNIHRVLQQDSSAVEHVISGTVEELAVLGRSPAR